METIEATYRIVTPMFIGGADQKPSDGIRPPSFKGALRFWWRALNWGKYQNLAKLHEKEADLFGSAASGDNGGQGKFLISIESHTAAAKMQVSNFSPRSYMLGQGLWGKGKLMREAITGSFDVKLTIKKSVSNEDVDSVLNAMEILGLVGGLGSRSRRGWGALCVERLALNKVEKALPKDKENYLRKLKSICESDVEIPPFTAMSRMSKVVTLHGLNSDPLAVVDKIGKEMGLYRGWGNNGKTFGQSSEKNFELDHDSMLAVTQHQSAHQAPKRLAFGMPHNYFFSSTKKKVDIQKAIGQNSIEFKRRGSPLMVHVHRFQDGRHIGVLKMLPATYLPHGVKVQIGRDQVEPDVDWTVIERFLQRPAFDALENL